MQSPSPAADPAAALGGRGPAALRAFGFAAFRRLWLFAVVDGFATGMERLAVGWLVLDATGSVFLAAVSFAVRNAPNIVFGPIAGAVADRFERRVVLAGSALTRAAASAAIAAVVITGFGGVWTVFVLVGVGGMARAFDMPATQALITDIVTTRGAANGVGLHSLGVRIAWVAGALVAGLLVEAAGVEWVFVVTAVLLLLAVAVVSTVRLGRRAAAGVCRSLWSEAVEGLRVMLGIPVVAALLVLALSVEVLAFSYHSLLPGVAREVLDVGAQGLGTLTTVAGLGAIGGAAALSLLGDRARRGTVLLGVTSTFGVLLVLFASTQRFELALLFIAGVGAMAALFDALQLVLLQSNVPDEMRGRVIGGWSTALGWGWLGPIVLGGTAEAVGLQPTIAVAGALVVALAVGASLLVPGLRRA